MGGVGGGRGKGSLSHRGRGWDRARKNLRVRSPRPWWRAAVTATLRAMKVTCFTRDSRGREACSSPLIWSYSAALRLGTLDRFRDRRQAERLARRRSA